MNHPQEPPDLDEGIDRQAPSQLRGRFLQLNRGRLARAQEGLSSRQQQVLKLLPLFFHLNHPLLPGYVSGATPAGVSGFEPEAGVLAEARRLTRSFTYEPGHDNRPGPIHGLYLMGSLGTLAQAEQSDMDLWVCHGADLSDTELGELRRKCLLLEAWAASQGAEAHLYLIESRGLVPGEHDGETSSDDCRTTRQCLLLDEFYRTAIWLAGRTPLWWLVPVCRERDYHTYTQTLLSRRLIRAEDNLDLGHLAHMPPGEFVGAGLWQLFKGVHSPHKSVLKLLLTEVYASEHPRVYCLSLAFKEAVFGNQLDLDALDPYIMVYRRIEQYLKHHDQPERLELVRRSLYLKVGKKLSSLGRQHDNCWQRRLLRRLTCEWGWDDNQLAMLDSRCQRKVAIERGELVAELNRSYQFLNQFARNLNASHCAAQRDLEAWATRCLRTQAEGTAPS